MFLLLKVTDSLPRGELMEKFISQIKWSDNDFLWETVNMFYKCMCGQTWQKNKLRRHFCCVNSDFFDSRMLWQNKLLFSRFSMINVTHSIFFFFLFLSFVLFRLIWFWFVDSYQHSCLNLCFTWATVSVTASTSTWLKCWAVQQRILQNSKCLNCHVPCV